MCAGGAEEFGGVGGVCEVELVCHGEAYVLDSACVGVFAFGVAEAVGDALLHG